MTPAFALRGLEVHAGRTRLLGPLDLTVEEGEHLLLVGASGSGKSTLLRAIAGLVRPTAGTVDWFGERASDGPRLRLPPERRRVGFLFQGGGLWPHMSVARTLSFALRSSGTPRADVARRTAELLELVELTGFDARRPGTLSGGERQRLSLARALAVSPRVLLLDEPLGPLDVELRAALLERLGDLQRRLHLTVVHVTHDPEEAAALATRRLRMQDGLLVEDDS